MATQQSSKLQSTLLSWADPLGLTCLAAGALLFLAGAAELPKIALGHPPSSVYGLWAAVATVALAGILVSIHDKDNPSLRLKSYGGAPAHWPSICASAAVGGFSFLLALDEPLLKAISMGLVAGFLSYLVVGRFFRAVWRTQWDRENAHIHRIERFVVEGRQLSEGPWTLVGSADDGAALNALRSEAHARFKKVRFWRIESNAALLDSIGSDSDLVFAMPVEASGVSVQEARSAARA